MAQISCLLPLGRYFIRCIVGLLEFPPHGPRMTVLITWVLSGPYTVYSIYQDTMVTLLKPRLSSSLALRPLVLDILYPPLETSAYTTAQASSHGRQWKGCRFSYVGLLPGFAILMLWISLSS